MLTKCASVIIWLLANILSGSADIDCSQRLQHNTINNCCAKPSLNFEAFRQSCGRFMADNRKSMSPCLYDCIFNVSQTLTGMQLNVDNAHRLTERLLGTNKEFVDIYATALENCAANESEMLKYKKRRFYGTDNCTLLPLYLGICAAEYVFVHCPSASWTRSRICEEALEYKNTCQCDISGRFCSAKSN
ncbi:uncharacterized protein LOC115763249 [Drosophila novamexicana]|uniref:uncharacterized protein LOC115763249 n=1 Tax=Drosophila novamexicana TaxID=47314 RepID=UPI0011E5980B|nr:uncharacterized protein LOC115763249 [Drosophila novamexicana]